MRPPGGVLFGWLGDRIGRVRAMTLSVLVYALFTGACGLAQSAEQIAALRFIASLGMGGEWSLGVALVMELWPNRSRALLAGLIGAAGECRLFADRPCVGLGLTGIIEDVGRWLSAIGLSAPLVDHLTGHQGWRLLMLSGTAPALLTFLIRLFVPESRTVARAAGSRHRHRIGRFAICWAWSIGALAALAIVYLAARVGSAAGAARRSARSWASWWPPPAFLYPVVRYIGRSESSHDAAGLSLRTHTHADVAGRWTERRGLAGDMGLDAMGADLGRPDDRSPNADGQELDANLRGAGSDFGHDSGRAWRAIGWDGGPPIA